jgi:hypothetical protein
MARCHMSAPRRKVVLVVVDGQFGLVLHVECQSTLAGSACGGAFDDGHGAFLRTAWGVATVAEDSGVRRKAR